MDLKADQVLDSLPLTRKSSQLFFFFSGVGWGNQTILLRAFGAGSKGWEDNRSDVLCASVTSSPSQPTNSLTAYFYSSLYIILFKQIESQPFQQNIPKDLKTDASRILFCTSPLFLIMKVYGLLSSHFHPINNYWVLTILKALYKARRIQVCQNSFEQEFVSSHSNSTI